MVRNWAVCLLALMPVGAEAGASQAEISFESCRVCHDTAAGAAIPPLRGRSTEDLTAAFSAMAAAPESQTIMHRFTSGFTAAELSELAEYIAAQPSAGGEGK